MENCLTMVSIIQATVLVKKYSRDDQCFEKI